MTGKRCGGKLGCETIDKAQFRSQPFRSWPMNCARRFRETRSPVFVAAMRVPDHWSAGSSGRILYPIMTFDR